MPLKNQLITEEMREGIKKYLRTNENTTIQNLWEAVKRFYKGSLYSYIRKQEKFQINNLTLHQKQLEKEEQQNPKLEEITKIKAEINEINIKKTIAKINETIIKADSLKR